MKKKLAPLQAKKATQRVMLRNAKLLKKKLNACSAIAAEISADRVLSGIGGDHAGSAAQAAALSIVSAIWSTHLILDLVEAEVIE